MRMHKIEEKEEISKIKSAMDKLHGSDLGYSYEWSVKGGNLVLKNLPSRHGRSWGLRGDYSCNGLVSA